MLCKNPFPYSESPLVGKVTVGSGTKSPGAAACGGAGGSWGYRGTILHFPLCFLLAAAVCSSGDFASVTAFERAFCVRFMETCLFGTCENAWWPRAGWVCSGLGSSASPAPRCWGPVLLGVHGSLFQVLPSHLVLSGLFILLFPHPGPAFGSHPQHPPKKNHSPLALTPPSLPSCCGGAGIPAAAGHQPAAQRFGWKRARAHPSLPCCTGLLVLRPHSPLGLLRNQGTIPGNGTLLKS